MKRGGTSSQAKGNTFNARSYVRPGLSEDEIIEIKQAFDLFDAEGTGSIDPKEIKQSLENMGFEAKSQSIYQYVCDLEADGAGHIVFEDFLHLMSTRVTAGDSRESLRKVFALFDDEKTGFVSIKSLRRICKQLGETIEEHEMQLMIEKADLDKDGLISEEQFYQILTGKGL